LQVGGAEAEFGFVLSKALPSRDKKYTMEEVVDGEKNKKKKKGFHLMRFHFLAIEALVPCMEIASLRVPASAGPLACIAGR